MHNLPKIPATKVASVDIRGQVRTERPVVKDVKKESTKQDLLKAERNRQFYTYAIYKCKDFDFL